jgi:nitrogen fixation NifU-like protein
MDIDAFTHLKEHAEHSLFKGNLKKPDVHVSGNNPLCGDTLAIDLKIEKGVIKDAKFIHKGCALSGASASLLLEYALNKKLASVQNMNPEIIFKLLGTPVSPARIHCALLSLAVLKSYKK